MFHTVSVHVQITMHLKVSNSTYIYIKLAGGCQTQIVHGDIYVIAVVLSSGAFIPTTASLAALWVVTMTIFGIVTAVLCWRIHKLKQNGITTNQIVAC